MSWLCLAIGMMIAALGVAISRFKQVKLLSNVGSDAVFNPAKATRHVAFDLELPGTCLSGFLETMRDRRLIVLLACFIPLNLIVVIGYLVA